MCILVTGGAGFVGVNLVKRLLAEDERVVAFDNLSNSSYSNMADFIQHPKFKFKNVNLGKLLNVPYCNSLIPLFSKHKIASF